MRWLLAGSAEELTPARRDWICVVPLAMARDRVAGRAEAGVALACGVWGEHLLDLNSIRLIESEDFR